MHRAEEAIGKAGVFAHQLQLFQRFKRRNGMENAILTILPERSSRHQSQCQSAHILGVDVRENPRRLQHVLPATFNPAQSQNHRQRKGYPGFFGFLTSLNHLTAVHSFTDFQQYLVIATFNTCVEYTQLQFLKFPELLNAPAQDVLRSSIRADSLQIREFLVQIFENFYQFRVWIYCGIAVLEKHSAPVPPLGYSVNHVVNIRQANSVLHKHSQRIYLSFSVSNLSHAELSAIETAEGAGIVGAAAGQGEEIALPFTGRAEYIRSLEFTGFLFSAYSSTFFFLNTF